MNWPLALIVSGAVLFVIGFVLAVYFMSMPAPPTGGAAVLIVHALHNVGLVLMVIGVGWALLKGAR